MNRVIIFLFLLSSVQAFFGVIKPQIIGGNKAAKCEFPSMASVSFRTSTTTYQCGGVLVDDNHVLTSATCFHPTVRKVQVKFGITRLDQRGMVRSGRLVTPHNKFNMVNLHNDIALITLDRKIQTTRCVHPIMLPQPGQTFNHRLCVTAGWGQTSVDSAGNKDLMRANLKIIPLGNCVRKLFYIQFAKQQICAGDLESHQANLCLGDQGGPLYCPDGRGNQVLAGIASFNYGCHDTASIFTSVSHYLDWIEKHNITSNDLITRKRASSWAKLFV